MSLVPPCIAWPGSWATCGPLERGGSSPGKRTGQGMPGTGRGEVGAGFGFAGIQITSSVF